MFCNPSIDELNDFYGDNPPYWDYNISTIAIFCDIIDEIIYNHDKLKTMSEVLKMWKKAIDFYSHILQKVLCQTLKGLPLSDNEYTFKQCIIPTIDRYRSKVFRWGDTRARDATLEEKCQFWQFSRHPYPALEDECVEAFTKILRHELEF